MKEAEALWAVAQHEPATSGDVATALGDKRQAATQVLKTLWDKRLLERQAQERDEFKPITYQYRLSEDYER